MVGVIPDRLADVELAHQGLTQLHVVRTMHERKALMGQLADGFLALPGGMGTLEEFTEIVTWSKLGLHTKPTALLNVAGYYDGLLGFFDEMVSQEFMTARDRSLVLDGVAVGALLERMEAWSPPPKPPRG